MTRKSRTAWIALSLAALSVSPTRADDKPVSFREQVAPILVGKCRSCHGSRVAGSRFRVDTYARLTGESSSGRTIEAGKPDESLFLDLLTSDDPLQRMPKDAAELPAEEVALLRRWIEQGAKFDGTDPSAELVAARPRPAAPAIYRAAVPILAMAFRPDGRELAVGGYHEVTIWDPSTGKLLRRIGDVSQRTQGLAYTADGSLLAIAGGSPGESGELKLVDPKDGRTVRTLGSSTDLLMGVAFSPDGSLVASCGADRSIGVHEVATGKELCRVRQFADWVTAVAFDREGKAVVASAADGLAKVFDARTGRLKASYPGHNAPVSAVATDAEGDRAVTAGADRKIHVWDPQVIAANDGTAALLEDRFKKDLISRTIDGFNDDILALAVSGGRVFSASADGAILAHDLKSLKPIHTYAARGEWAYVLAVDPRSKLLAAGGFDGTVRIWDVTDGRLVREFLAAPGLEKPVSR